MNLLILSLSNEQTATDTAFLLFWTAAVFASILWYTFLLFWLGIRAGGDIRRMTRDYTDRPNPPKTDRPAGTVDSSDGPE